MGVRVGSVPKKRIAQLASTRHDDAPTRAIATLQPLDALLPYPLSLTAEQFFDESRRGAGIEVIAAVR
jgi:hypothetical protein